MSFKGRKFSREHKEKLSLSHMGKPGPNKGKIMSKETREKIRQKLLGHKHTEDAKRKISDAWKPHSEESKKKMSEKRILYLKNRAPNHPSMCKDEKFLFNRWLEKAGFEYVGDWSLWINRKNPDFINKSKKLIVEYNSEWWHRNETNAQTRRRIDLFKSAGYDTLIIWEHELKNIDVLEQKLLNFC